MRFISPSFNQQGWTENFDLNSIAKGTSPAYSLHTEHPSGNEYADYLDAIVKLNKLKKLEDAPVEFVWLLLTNTHFHSFTQSHFHT